MARKSDGEKIDELQQIVSTLVERLDNVRREMIDRERVAPIEERLNEFKRTIEEAGRRRWGHGPCPSYNKDHLLLVSSSASAPAS
jgi:hypothetical protein